MIFLFTKFVYMKNKLILLRDSIYKGNSEEQLQSWIIAYLEHQTILKNAADH